jgi:hypothetical protein
MYHTVYLERNKFDDEGLSWLTKSNWKELKNIKIKNNHITDKGCKFLTKTNWLTL